MKVLYLPDIGIMVRVFANGPGDLSSIPDRVIPTTKKKTVLDATLLNTQNYKIRVKSRNPGKGVAPFPKPWGSNYRKGSLRVTLTTVINNYEAAVQYVISYAT